MTPFIKNLIDTAPNMPREIFEEIRKVGTVTGSYVFCDKENYNDIDAILPINFKYSVEELTNLGAIRSQNYMPNIKSLYVKFENNDNIYNLLLMQDYKTYNNWIETTRVISRLIKMNNSIKESIKDKKLRIKLFETILSMV